MGDRLPLDSMKSERKGKSDKKGLRRLGQRFAASLSLKLMAIFVGGSLFLAILMGSLSQFGLERQFLTTARPLLKHYIHFLAKEVGSPPSVARARNLTEKWPVTIRIFDPQRKIKWASDGRLREPNLAKEANFLRGRRHARVFWDRGTVLMKRQVGSARVYYGFRVRPPGPPWFVLVFLSLVLAGIFGFYFLTRRLFAPIKTIQHGINMIGEGQLSHRIDVRRRDELGSLAMHVNEMAAQLESMLRAKRDLLLAISHELKSPLARSRVTLELMDDTNYRKALLRDQQQMLELIEGIIDAERNQSNAALLHRQPTNLTALIGRVVNGFESPDRIEIDMNSGLHTVNVDAVQIERLLRNLLENALRYNRDELGSVKIEVTLGQRELMMMVSDHGQGIEAHHINRLTEAFYRVDVSRERNTGGLGLGLYLCQAVLNAHGGSLTITSKPGTGTRVECRIPLTKSV
jgi:signal transduction histidine kinase